MIHELEKSSFFKDSIFVYCTLMKTYLQEFMKGDEIDYIIYNILLSRMDQNKKIQDLISYEKLMKLIISAKYFTDNEPILFRIDAPISIVGDIHGNLVLVDYVDRGKYSIEVI